jgi:hypothetical protein
MTEKETREMENELRVSLRDYIDLLDLRTPLGP